MSKKEPSIRISPKYGVNPAIPLCFFCGKEKNEIILVGKLKDDAEAPRNVVWDKVPCENCKNWMQAGIILIEVDEEKTDDRENPYRTGALCVIKEEALKRILPEELFHQVKKSRMAFLPIEVWNHLELPRENFGEMNS